jgi:hypothetical protein
MLTCFEANTAAKALYDKLGYVVDASSPDPEVDGPEFDGYVTLYALQTNIMCTGTAVHVHCSLQRHCSSCRLVRRRTLKHLM